MRPCFGATSSRVAGALHSRVRYTGARHPLPRDRLRLPPGRARGLHYQNLDGRGWEALADALALAGIRPVRRWLMFGDGGAGLYKHANPISWDCVLHCFLDKGPIARSKVEADAGNGFSDAWRARLAEDGHALTPGDGANLRHAGRVLASFVPMAAAGEAGRLAQAVPEPRRARPLA